MKRPWLIIGNIDSYGAVHLKKVYDDSPPEHSYHLHWWPTGQGKNWRFVVDEWVFTFVPFTERLTLEEADSIERQIRKVITPPRWVLWGDFWAENGSPSGAAFDELKTKFDELYPLQEE